jgi:hypothetical protein
MRATDIVAALGGRRGLAPCPAHNDRTPSLSVSDGEQGLILVHCHAGCGQREVIDALRRLGAWPECTAEPPLMSEAERERWRRQGVERQRERSRRDAFVERTWQQAWSEAMPAPDSPIERWLQHRGIDRGKLELDRLPLRWAPRCPRGKETAPAMVALMTDPITAEPCGLHRTFLLPDGSGKAPVEPLRQMLGKASLIRLSPDEEVELGLGICEGIETGLAIMAAGWHPVWACGSLGLLKCFRVLTGIEALTVFADPKPHEVAGARECADRWVAAGREAVVRIPRDGDWNDALWETA